jgi:hypothetical protein
MSLHPPSHLFIHGISLLISSFQKILSLQLSLCVQVLQGRRRVDKAAQDLKGEIKGYLKRHPLTLKYAKEPFLTYALYATFVLSLVLCLLPLFAISGEPSSDTCFTLCGLHL